MVYLIFRVVLQCWHTLSWSFPRQEVHRSRSPDLEGALRQNQRHCRHMAQIPGADDRDVEFQWIWTVEEMIVTTEALAMPRRWAVYLSPETSVSCCPMNEETSRLTR
jgi:hypothetical protein